MLNKIKRNFPGFMKVYRDTTRYIPDKYFISWQFKRYLGYQMNWEKPETFNQKLQWLKLNWHDPLATQCADKFAVRSYIQKHLDKNILNEVYGVYEKVEDIDIDSLPNSFVLKGTHGSGMNIICRDKNSINWVEAKNTMKRWLNTNYYYGTREWVYRDIKPQIICEKFLEGIDGRPPIDYKFFCFNGEPLVVLTCSDRFGEMKLDFYNCEWNRLPISRYKHPNSSSEVPRPINLENMLSICRKLAKPFPFVRVDLYEVDAKIYFGELTFFPGNGAEKFSAIEQDHELGKYLTLPK